MEENNNEKISVSGADLLKDVVADEKAAKTAPKDTEKDKKDKDKKFTKFNFIYRKRMWNEGEEAYLGWERKRGLLNQFNEYILGNISNPFKSLTGLPIHKVSLTELSHRTYCTSRVIYS